MSALISFHDKELPVSSIGALYRNRWPMGSFFPWIKPPLRITRFFAAPGNTVQTPIRIAIFLRLLGAISKKRPARMSSVPLFE